MSRRWEIFARSNPAIKDLDWKNHSRVFFHLPTTNTSYLITKTYVIPIAAKKEEPKAEEAWDDSPSEDTPLLLSPSVFTKPPDF